MGWVGDVQKGREFKLQVRCFECRKDHYVPALFEDGETMDKAMSRAAAAVAFACDACPSVGGIVVGAVRSGAPYARPYA